MTEGTPAGLQLYENWVTEGSTWSRESGGDRERLQAARPGTPDPWWPLAVDCQSKRLGAKPQETMEGMEGIDMEEKLKLGTSTTIPPSDDWHSIERTVTIPLRSRAACTCHNISSQRRQHCGGSVHNIMDLLISISCPMTIGCPFACHEGT